MKLTRILALLLAAVLLSGLPALAYGGEAPAPDGLFALEAVSSGTGDIAIEDEAASAPAPALRAGVMSVDGWSGSVPSRYDPRDSGVLPPVRSQGQWSTCWAIAAITAAETDGLKKGLLLTSAAATDLSERHLIYFLAHQADDPLGNSSNDYNINPSFWIRSGGNPVFATMTLASWHGAASEAATASPYSGLTLSDYLNPLFAYTDILHLENTYALDISDAAGRAALKSMLLDHGSAVLCLYFNNAYLFSGSPSAQSEQPAAPDEPDDTDPSGHIDANDPMRDPIADAEAPEADAPADEPGEPEGDPELPSEPEPGDMPEDGISAEDAGAATEAPAPGEAEELPADSGETPVLDGEPEAEAEDESGSPSDPAGEAGPEAADGADDGGEAPAIDGADDDFTVCYYQNSSRTSNHEVVIVGWDDDYPAGNFGYSERGAVPPGDGAWLCRNSHGSSWAGGDGYFWLSYYDACAAASTGGTISGRVTVFDFASADNYDNNYEYDGAVVLGYVNDKLNGRGVSTTSANAGTRSWYANIFTASAHGELRGTEILRAVSTYTYRANVPYTVQVYTGLSDPADPTSGVKAAEISGSFPYAGYHTVALPRSIALEEGERFSVVFRIGMAADGTLFVPACYTSSNWYSTNETLAGQSFVSVNGTDFVDCHTLTNQPNVRIKAFTDNADAVFPFTDVSAGAWYYGDVRESWLHYLVNGTSATTFAPTASATRAQVVTVLWRLSGQPAPRSAPSFSDVDSGAWYADAVAWAGENGIVTGYSGGTFRPSATITRQEFMAVLYRYAAFCGADTSQRADISSYSDAGRVGAWAADAMRWSIASGVQQGVGTGSGSILDPQGRVTRAQLAAFLNRLTDMLG